MLKLITVILMLAAGTFVYQTFFAVTPDYVESLKMMYWSITTTAALFISGLLKTGDKQQVSYEVDKNNIITTHCSYGRIFPCCTGKQFFLQFIHRVGWIYDCNGVLHSKIRLIQLEVSYERLQDI